MTTIKSLRGRAASVPPFFGAANEHAFIRKQLFSAKSPQSQANSAPYVPLAKAKRKAKSEAFIDGVVDGERVLIAKAPREREKGIEIRIRVALASAGVLVWKHHVDNRRMLTGLGLGTSDLICVVPPFGRFLGIEVKKPGYSPSDVRLDQRRWLATVRRFGGIAGIATTVEEALALVAQARGAA